MSKTKEKEKEKETKTKELANLYPPMELEVENAGYIKLMFENWNFADFSKVMKTKDVVYHLEIAIKNRNSGIKNIHIYTDPNKTKEIITFTDNLGKIFKTKGKNTIADAEHFKIYYEFDTSLNSPLLLA